jgi:hypothetical protein
MRGECFLECRGVFFESPIAIVALMTFYVLTVSYSVYVAFKQVGYDDKGVIKELFSVPFLAGSVTGAVWILVMVDINDLAFNRVFDWQYVSYIL